MERFSATIGIVLAEIVVQILSVARIRHCNRMAEKCQDMAEIIGKGETGGSLDLRESRRVDTSHWQREAHQWMRLATGEGRWTSLFWIMGTVGVALVMFR